METVIVEIFLPAISRACDFIMPAHIPVGNLLGDLIETIRTATGAELDREYPCLCDMEQKRPIPYDKTLSQCGIRDSSRLMLL